MSLLLYGIIAVVVIVVLWLLFTYNGLVTLRNRIENAWSQIDVQLKLRYDLVPNLVETIKGYAKHEREVFENVTKARASMMGAKTVGEKAKADNMLTGALKTLFAVAEAYPTLRANENFLRLQEELSGIENKIAYSRRFYNDSVLEFNTSIQVMPGALVAGPLGFKAEEYFKTEGEGEREPVKVKF
ncbi:MAG: LemA family protein [Candidatus Micrarchaeota archaeon]